MGFSSWNGRCEISEMVGKTFDRIEKTDESVTFWNKDKSDSFLMEHLQDCCENVWLEDVVGDLNDLVGTPILVAECVTSEESPRNDSDESFLWTFYNMRTIKGSVTFRWYGTSNGYYSESVDIIKWSGEDDAED